MYLHILVMSVIIVIVVLFSCSITTIINTLTLVTITRVMLIVVTLAGPWVGIVSVGWVICSGKVRFVDFAAPSLFYSLFKVQCTCVLKNVRFKLCTGVLLFFFSSICQSPSHLLAKQLCLWNSLVFQCVSVISWVNPSVQSHWLLQQRVPPE